MLQRFEVPRLSHQYLIRQKDSLRTIYVLAVFLEGWLRVSESVSQRVEKKRCTIVISNAKIFFGFEVQDLHPSPKNKSDLLHNEYLKLSEDRFRKTHLEHVPNDKTTETEGVEK